MIKAKTENRKISADEFLTAEYLEKMQHFLNVMERLEKPGNKEEILNRALKFLSETESKDDRSGS